MLLAQLKHATRPGNTVTLALGGSVFGDLVFPNFPGLSINTLTIGVAITINPFALTNFQLSGEGSVYNTSVTLSLYYASNPMEATGIQVSVQATLDLQVGEHVSVSFACVVTMADQAKSTVIVIIMCVHPAP